MKRSIPISHLPRCRRCSILITIECPILLGGRKACPRKIRVGAAQLASPKTVKTRRVRVARKRGYETAIELIRRQSKGWRSLSPNAFQYSRTSIPKIKHLVCGYQCERDATSRLWHFSHPVLANLEALEEAADTRSLTCHA